MIKGKDWLTRFVFEGVFTTETQRTQSFAEFLASLRNLCVLCVSVVNAFLLFLAILFTATLLPSIRPSTRVL